LHGGQAENGRDQNSSKGTGELSLNWVAPRTQIGNALIHAECGSQRPARYDAAFKPDAQIGERSGVLIYTTAYCPYCKAAKDLLRRKGVSFTEVDVDRESGAADVMVRRSGGGRTVPQTFIGQTHAAEPTTWRRSTNPGSSPRFWRLVAPNCTQWPGVSLFAPAMYS
jgi:glutaredoxin 3